jgi:DNA polymerase-3 subunit gamma/tau
LRQNPAASLPRLAAAQAPQSQIAPTAQATPTVSLKNFAELVALAGAQRDIQTKTALERDVRLVRFEQGRLEFALTPGASPALTAQLARKLQDWTGQRWLVALSNEPGEPTLAERSETREQEKRLGVQAHPLVRAALQQFPGAVIVAVRGAETSEDPGESRGDDVGYIDESQDEDS